LSLVCFAIGDVDWAPVEFRLKVPWRRGFPCHKLPQRAGRSNLDLVIRVEAPKTMLDAEIVFKMKFVAAAGDECPVLAILYSITL
jgi:hypothetical protein